MEPTVIRPEYRLEQFTCPHCSELIQEVARDRDYRGAGARAGHAPRPPCQGHHPSTSAGASGLA